MRRAEESAKIAAGKASALQRDLNAARYEHDSTPIFSMVAVLRSAVLYLPKCWGTN